MFDRDLHAPWLLLEVLAFATAITASNLVAVWAATSNVSVLRRLVIPATVLGGICLVAYFLPLFEPLQLGLLLALEMVKVGGILIVARRAVVRPLRFSLGELMVLTAVAAVMLGIATLPSLKADLPTAAMLAVGGTFSALTLATLWAVFAGRPPARLRWTVLALFLVFGGYLLAGMLDPVGAIGANKRTQAFFIYLTSGLGEHALLVAAMSWSWTLAIRRNPKDAGPQGPGAGRKDESESAVWCS